MEDLNQTFEILSMSSDLEKAADLLKKMSVGQPINESDANILYWAGAFLSAMDWGEHVTRAPTDGGGLAVQATTVRPTFYSCLFRLAPKLREAGVSSEDDVSHLLSSLYRNLLLSGAPGRGHKKLSERESELGAILLHEIAESLLVQINHNGLPESPTLRNDWYPTADEHLTVTAF